MAIEAVVHGKYYKWRVRTDCPNCQAVLESTYKDLTKPQPGNPALQNYTCVCPECNTRVDVDMSKGAVDSQDSSGT